MNNQIHAWLKSLMPQCPLNFLEDRGIQPLEINNKKAVNLLILMGELSCAKH